MGGSGRCADEIAQLRPCGILARPDAPVEAAGIEAEGDRGHSGRRLGRDELKEILRVIAQLQHAGVPGDAREGHASGGIELHEACIEALDERIVGNGC